MIRRYVCVSAPGGRHVRPRPRGQPQPDVERHAVPSGPHLQGGAARQGERLDRQRREEER